MSRPSQISRIRKGRAVESPPTCLKRRQTPRPDSSKAAQFDRHLCIVQTRSSVPMRGVSRGLQPACQIITLRLAPRIRALVSSLGALTYQGKSSKAPSKRTSTRSTRTSKSERTPRSRAWRLIRLASGHTRLRTLRKSNPLRILKSASVSTISYKQVVAASGLRQQIKPCPNQ